MHEKEELFGMALGLVDPWYMERVVFDPASSELELHVDFRRGGVFRCGECGASGCKAYDSETRRWRHLNFFQYRTSVSARTPRVQCPRCGVRPAEVPWARPGSGFTVLFEALILQMAPHMPVAAIARLVGEHDTRLWRVLDFYVQQARAERKDRGVRAVGMDEKAVRRGHHYVSTFVDLEKARVLFATEGKDAGTVERFRKDLEAHGGEAKQIEEICCDMSPAYLAGIAEQFPKAAVTFDKFHVLRIITAAVDQTRREERRAYPELKGQRYALLRKPDSMSDRELEFVSTLLLHKSAMKTAKALHLSLVFRDFYEQPRRRAEIFLKKWYDWAIRSRVPAMVQAAQTIRRHWTGVLRWFISQITNGLLEGINSLIQAAKAKARGYRTTRNLITMIYLIAGKLDYNVTHLR